MISLAIDTATDRCSVAATDGVNISHRELAGARRHAGAVLQLIEEVLHEVGANNRQIDRVLTADGPGSFTGLRVGSTVAKALTWRRSTVWSVAPSLLLRAFAHAPEAGGKVLALSDALRGEVYAGAWEFSARGIVSLDGAPRARNPESLRDFVSLNVVVGSVPEALIPAINSATGCTMISDSTALPDARTLFRLADIPGGTTTILDPVAWEPEYGRPAEAQAVWERKHGRPLPNTPVIAR